MVRNIFQTGVMLAIFTSVIFLANNYDRKKHFGTTGYSACQEDLQGRVDWEFNRVKDPATGKIPFGIFKAEQEYAATLPSDKSFMQKSVSWIPRGPFNVGGRTRGAAIDVADENTIIAGGVSGGVWKTTNGGTSWYQVLGAQQLHNVTTLTQDRRPGHTNNWYFGTGEYYGNSAGAYGADFIGNGIFKSTDNGESWFSLASTASNTPEYQDSLWDYTWRVATDPSNLTEDVVYAAVYRGLYRSTNGGVTWKKALAGSLGGSAIFTDVAVTSQGIVYAAISSGGISKCIWRSVDGINWVNIRPSTFPTSYKRIVIGINTSDENEIYFFANTPGQGQPSVNFSNETEYVSLFKYRYLTGDGAGTNGEWTNLSANLPNNGTTNFDNIFTQDSYDMVVAVKPGDANTVFVGGTNLYRSTDGFTTMNNTTQIGGYRIGSYFPYWDVYKNHHPDQHGIMFLPSNPSVMITYTDGGLYRTNDCNADTVVWHSINNGYRNSQVYTVTVNKFQNNDVLVAGFQDNGNYFTNNANPYYHWKMPLNGDGSFAAITNDGATYYLSIQQGKMYKMTIDSSGTPTGFNRIDPTGGVAANYIFINPFVLDPNNNDIMYVPCYNTIWRNNILSQIPLAGNYDTISTGWTKFSNLADYYINAMAVSKTPANKLYYGTLNGTIYKMSNADQGDPAPEIISNYTHTNFNASCIAVDPDDADRVLVVYSNYKIYSLFFTEDGGTTWKKVAGNLEEYPDGTGNGPSCRWASMLHVGNQTLYFVGTSVGLFATDTLIDNATVWTNIASNTIGNVVINMVETRDSDGLVVVGTHGNGIYSTRVTSIDEVLNSIGNRDPFAVAPLIYPNPAIDQISIKLSLAKKSDIEISIFNISGKNIFTTKTFLEPGETNFPLNIASYNAGKYFCRVNIGKYSKTQAFVKIK